MLSRVDAGRLLAVSLLSMLPSESAMQLVLLSVSGKVEKRHDSTYTLKSMHKMFAVLLF